MLFKMLAVTGAIAMLGVSAAMAAPPTGKSTGKPAPTGSACKPRVSVILTGSITAHSAPASVAVGLSGGNNHAKAYRTAHRPVTILLTTATKSIRGNSHDALSLVAGDRVNVRAVVCKADLANGATPALTALRFVAHPAKSS